MIQRLSGNAAPEGGSYALWYCRRCEIAQTVPKPTPAELGRLYATSHYRTESGRRFIGPIEALVTWFNRLKARNLCRHGAAGSILDIGCGRGIFLGILRREGWQTTGVEFNAETASYASRVYGIEVITIGDMERLREKSFDVITMFHVLEHVELPMELLDRCQRLLREDGRLIIAVPNIASLQAAAGRSAWFHLDLPYHLHHFTTEGLLRLLRSRGFSIESIRHFDPEQNLYGWLQTLLNRSGIGMNFLYNALKQRTLRSPGRAGSVALNVLLTAVLLPVYLPLAVLLSVAESAILKRGGTIEVVAVNKPATHSDP